MGSKNQKIPLSLVMGDRTTSDIEKSLHSYKKFFGYFPDLLLVNKKYLEDLALKKYLEELAINRKIEVSTI